MKSYELSTKNILAGHELTMSYTQQALTRYFVNKDVKKKILCKWN